MAKSPQDAVNNWTQAMGSQTTQNKYKQGIQGTTENPMAKAATPEAEQRFLASVTDSVNSGRRSKALLAVSMATWQQNAMNIGAAALSTGAAKAKSKVTAHFNDWMPTYQQAKQVVQNMPKGGKVNALNRIGAVLDLYYQKSGKAG